MEKINTELRGLIKTVGLQFKEFPWENPASYKNWLAQTYFYVRHTTCFLALCASRWGVENREQQYQSLSHLRGELSHDLLLIDDLRAMGSSIEAHHEWPLTQVFYQAQYYWIEHKTPAAHLGYAYLLEGIASQNANGAYKKVLQSHGAKAASFLKVHSEEDVGHYEAGLNNLEKLNEYELNCFIESARQTALLYSQILLDAKKRIESL